MVSRLTTPQVERKCDWNAGEQTNLSCLCTNLIKVAHYTQCGSLATIGQWNGESNPVNQLVCVCVCVFKSLPVKEIGRERVHCTMSQ